MTWDSSLLRWVPKLLVDSRFSSRSGITSSLSVRARDPRYPPKLSMFLLMSTSFSRRYIRLLSRDISISLAFMEAVLALTISLSTAISSCFYFSRSFKSLTVAWVSYLILTSACMSFFFVSALLSFARLRAASCFSKSASLSLIWSSMALARLDV